MHGLVQAARTAELSRLPNGVGSLLIVGGGGGGGDDAPESDLCSFIVRSDPSYIARLSRPRLINAMYRGLIRPC